MGGRVITEVSNIMFEQFVNNFRKQLQSPEAANGEPTEAKPISGVGLAFSALKASFSRHPGSEEAKPDAATLNPVTPDPAKPDSGTK
jgi:hypothetical protein